MVPTECQVNNLCVKYQDELLCQTLLHSFYHIDCNNLSVLWQYERLCRTLLYNFYHIDCNNLSVICQYEWLCRTLLYNFFHIDCNNLSVICQNEQLCLTFITFITLKANIIWNKYLNRIKVILFNFDWLKHFFLFHKRFNF